MAHALERMWKGFGSELKVLFRNVSGMTETIYKALRRTAGPLVEILLRDLQDRSKDSLSAENIAQLVSLKAVLFVTPTKWPAAVRTAADKTLSPITHE